MNYYKYLSKDMFLDYTKIDLGEKNNSLLLINLLFYGEKLEYSYEFLNKNISFDKDTLSNNTDDIKDLFDNTIGMNLSFENYIMQVLKSIFYIDLDLHSYKKFSKQIVEIFNVLHKEETSFANFLSHSNETPNSKKMFSASIMKSILLLVRRNVKPANRRKFQRKIVELYFLKFDFNLEILEEENNKERLYQILLLIDYFENEKNYSNEHVIRAIEYSNKAYFNRDKDIIYIENHMHYYIKHYIQSKLLINIDFNNIDYFMLTGIIYFLTPKFINYFSDKFDQKKLNNFKQSRFKFLNEINPSNFNKYRSEEVIFNNLEAGIQELKSYNILVDIDQVYKLFDEITSESKKLSLFYFGSLDFNFFSKENSVIFIEQVRKLIKLSRSLKDFEKQILSDFNIIEMNAPYLRRNPGEMSDEEIEEMLYNNNNSFINHYTHEYIISPLEDIINKYAYFIELHFPLDQILLENDLNKIYNKILVGDDFSKYTNYNKKKKELEKLIELGLESQRRLEIYRDDIFDEFEDRLKTHYNEEIKIINKNIQEMKIAKLELKQLEHYNTTIPITVNISESTDRIKLLSMFNYNSAKLSVVKSLFQDVSESFYYAKYDRLSKSAIMDNINILNENKYYDWLYTLSLSKYLLDYYEVNIDKHFENDANIDWTFIYVLLTKSLENLIANFIEYMLLKDSNVLSYAYNKFGKKQVLDLNNPRWREGLTIGDLRLILETLLGDNIDGIVDLSFRIRSLLQEDRNKYLHHNALKGFNNLKNIYFSRIFELVYMIISKIE